MQTANQHIKHKNNCYFNFNQTTKLLYFKLQDNSYREFYQQKRIVLCTVAFHKFCFIFYLI